MHSLAHESARKAVKFSYTGDVWVAVDIAANITVNGERVSLRTSTNDASSIGAIHISANGEQLAVSRPASGVIHVLAFRDMSWTLVDTITTSHIHGSRGFHISSGMNLIAYETTAEFGRHANVIIMVKDGSVWKMDQVVFLRESETSVMSVDSLTLITFGPMHALRVFRRKMGASNRAKYVNVATRDLFISGPVDEGSMTADGFLFAARGVNTYANSNNTRKTFVLDLSKIISGESNSLTDITDLNNGIHSVHLSSRGNFVAIDTTNGWFSTDTFIRRGATWSFESTFSIERDKGSSQDVSTTAFSGDERKMLRIMTN